MKISVDDESVAANDGVLLISEKWIIRILVMFAFFSPILLRVEYNLDFGSLVVFMGVFYTLTSVGGPFVGSIDFQQALITTPVFLLPQLLFVWYMRKYYRNQTSKSNLILAGLFEEMPKIIVSVFYASAPIFNYFRILVPIPMLLLAGMVLIIMLPPQRRQDESIVFREPGLES